MVPPLVAINAKYYGKRVAFYIAAVMFVSILFTALTMQAAFGILGLAPESARGMEQVSRFAIDYTLFLNLAMAGVAGVMICLHRAHVLGQSTAENGGMKQTGVKRLVVYTMLVLVAGGTALRLAGW